MTTEPTAEETRTEPTPEELSAMRQQSSLIFRDIAQLLKDCVFPGVLAARVVASIDHLERLAAATGPIAKAEEKRKRKALKRTKLAAAPEVKTDG